MTVKQLIEKLQQHHPDKLVLVSGYEEGYDDLNEVREIKVNYKPNNKHWQGDYTDYPLVGCEIEAILLPR